MRAMVLEKIGKNLQYVKDYVLPNLEPHQILIEIEACGVCRTDLHIFDGELSHPHLPLILGHQVVGKVKELGKKVKQLNIGQRVGVPWLGGSCHHCEFCERGKENLCSHAVFTGYQLQGGFAEECIANASFCLPLPEKMPAEQLAPLLCGGLIGYRAYKMAGHGNSIGFYGYGSSAHILTQVAHKQKRRVYAFTRPGDEEGQQFALQQGVFWTGGSDTLPPIKLDSVIIFAPVGELVPQALKAVKKGGTVVCAGIHMSDIPQFPYELLWEERVLRSVANLTRKDGRQFMDYVAQNPIKTSVKVYPLTQANQALNDLRSGKIKGSAVLLTTEL
ncbi:MAG: zinc-dependent alcohol dehydrogenase family protein [Chlamydiales bacterium]